MSTIVPIDIGYSSTKIFLDGKSMVLPSTWNVVGDLTGVAGGQSRRQTIKLDGTTYQIGVPNSVSTKRMSPEWVTSKQYQALALYPIAKMIDEDYVETKIFTGLPYQDRKLSNRLKINLLGEHNFVLDDKEKRTVVVKDCFVFVQSIAPMFGLALDVNGKIHQDFGTKVVGVVNLGGFTSDIGTALISNEEKRFAEVEEQCRTLPKGMLVIADFISKKIQDRFNTPRLSMAQVVEVIKEEKVSVYGEYHDVSDIVQEGINIYANTLADEIMTTWSPQNEYDLRSLDKLILTGGGIHKVKEPLEEMLGLKSSNGGYGFLYVPNDPVLDTVISYSKFAKFIGYC